MRVCSLVLSIVLLVSSSAAFAEPSPATDESLYSCKKNPTAVEITLKPEIELKELVAWVVGFTCKRFVFDPRIVATGRKVTLIAPGKQSPAQAYEMFVTALAAMGYSVVPSGNLMKIVETQSSRTSSLAIYRKEPPANSEQMVRYVMKPSYTQPETLKLAFGSLKSEAGDIQTIGSLLLITDHASNVRDMLSIAKLVDVAGASDGIYAIPIKHADATKLADKLSALLGVGGATPGTAIGPAKHGGSPAATVETAAVPTKLLVDDRTNTLMLTGSEAAYMRVKALVERLDVALDIDGGTAMHVYQLGSAVAEELAKTLTEALQSGGASTRPTGGSEGRRDPLAAVEGPVRVISDKPTNKLIVMASGRDFLAIRDVIRQLDVPRRQVYIEAVVLEVQVGNGLAVGTSAHGALPGTSGSLLMGGVQAPDLRSTSPDKLVSGNGLLGGLLGPKHTALSHLLGQSFPSYAILVQALADTSRTNILSTMPIIVVDNEQAKYKVGENIPYTRGTVPANPAAPGLNQLQNIDRKDLVLELEIKPHISTDDAVLLEVKQSGEDRGEDHPVLGPSWTTRSIETRVLVRDQQTIVLGGLMQHREITTTAKVPLLGDLPLLGYLFKYSRKTRKKLNLLVMLTPYIIKDHLELEAIRARKQREHEEFFGSLRAFEGAILQPRIDYRRKRGLIEEINRAILDVEADQAARESLRPPVHVTPGPIEVESTPSTP
jgi:general secretion pathway protein D